MAAVELINSTLYTDANLKAYYRYSTDGTDTKSGFNQTLTGTPAFSTGKFGNAIDFGSSQTNGKYGKYTGNAGVDGGNVTLLAWFNVTTSPTDANQHVVISQGSTNTFTGYDIRVMYNGGTPQVRFTRAKGQVADETTSYTFTPTPGTWYLVALTYDTTNIRGYINGVLVAGPTAASGNGTGLVTDGIVTGDRPFAGGVLGASFPGLVDDFAVFDRVLSTAEILAHYEGTDAVATATGNMFSLF